MPKSLFLIPLSFAFYFVPEVGVDAQKFDFKSHLSFAFYFVPEVRVGAQKSVFNPIIFCLLFCTGSRRRCPKVLYLILLSFAFYFVPDVEVEAQNLDF